MDLGSSEVSGLPKVTQRNGHANILKNSPDSESRNQELFLPFLLVSYILCCFLGITL